MTAAAAAAKFANTLPPVNTVGDSDDTYAAQPPNAAYPPAQGPPSRRASTDASHINKDDNGSNSKFTSAASAPATSAGLGKSNNNSKNNKPSKPRTILMPPASLYCSERCRLADQRNYASGSGVAGVIYSPSSSYTSASFVAPPGIGLGVLSSSYPAAQGAPTVGGPAPAASRNSSQSRSRTRGGLSRHGSATVINTALANASASSPANPYYLASPLLSPVPSYPSHRSRHQSSYSGNGSDDEDHYFRQHSSGATPPTPVTYAYDPDRANGDYFRSLRRGERQGYFTTAATVVPPPQSPVKKDGETSSESAGSGAPPWDYTDANGAGLSTSARAGVNFGVGVGGRSDRHTAFGVQSMTSIHNHRSSSSVSLVQLHGAAATSASGVTPTAAPRHTPSSSSSSRPRKPLLPKGGNGTSAPAYVPTNGYLTHFSSLSLNNAAAGNGHGYGHQFGYAYPERPPYRSGYSYGPGGYGRGYGWGRSSTSSSSSRRRQRDATKDTDGNGVSSKERDDCRTATNANLNSTKRPERQRGFFPLRTDAEERLPLFALEPAYPGPLSSTSDSEVSDGDEEDGLTMDGGRRSRRRRSSGENTSKDGMRPESMTTAPSTESVQALLTAEALSESSLTIAKGKEKELAAVVANATPRRPMPSRRGTATIEAHPSKSSISLGVVLKNDKAASSSKKIRHHRVSSSVSMGKGISRTAPSIPSGGGPLSSSPFSSTVAGPSSRRHSKSSITTTKARPEHQHGLLVHVSLPRTSTTSTHSRSRSMGNTNLDLGHLGAAKLAPSVSNIDASGTLVAAAALASSSQISTSLGSGVIPTIDELLNSVPVHDVLPPRNHSSYIPRGGGGGGGEADVPRGPAWSGMGMGTGFNDSIATAAAIGRHGGTAKTQRTPALSRTGSTNHIRLVQDDGDGLALGLGVDLETYVPTYPMEVLPGQPGEKRKRCVLILLAFPSFRCALSR